MLGGVGDQLAGQREDERVVDPGRRGVDVHRRRKAGAPAGLCGDRPERRFEPGLLDAKYLVSNRYSIAALRDLVFKEGIFGGPSCGAVLVAAAREAKAMTSGTVVALLPDGGWKYLSAGTFSANLDEMDEALEGGVNWW